MAVDVTSTGQYDVVAFGAHPDDLEHGMGGTLLKLARDGVKLLLVHATRGEGGTHGDGDLREREATAAAKFLGAGIRFLGFQDLNVRDSTEARRTVAALLRETRPHTVFAPYYDYPYMHPDHEEMGKIVRGVTRLTRIRNFVPGLEPHAVKHFFYYIVPPHLRPTFILDVTDFMEDWEKLAGCYASQLEGFAGYHDLLHTFRKQYGMLIGRPYAEAFYSDRPIDLSPIDLNLLRGDGKKTLHH